MESDLHKDFRLHPQTIMNPGLTRFRSAPSSFFATLLESCEEFLDRPSSPETERMMTRLLSCGDIADNLDPHNLSPNEANSNTATATSQQSQFMGYSKSEAEVLHNNSDNRSYSAAPPRSFYPNSGQPPLLTRKVAAGGGGSNLIRQSSSPAGFFSNINNDSGSYSMRGMDKLSGVNLPTKKVGEMMPPAAPVFVSNTNLAPSRVDSSMAQMIVIPEIADTRIVGSEIQDHDFIPIESWEGESTMNIEENSRSLKRTRDRDSKPFSDVQINEEGRHRVPPILSHHLSLPRMSPDMSEIEKFLDLQDSVPCKTRAKRGCATHPRSIAERVRRTKISERMRKLQDVVPNMDKQTNTSDMLDLAVEYIKDLQEQVKMMTANRATCTCLYRHPL